MCAALYSLVVENIHAEWSRIVDIMLLNALIFAQDFFPRPHNIIVVPVLFQHYAFCTQYFCYFHGYM